MAGVKFTEKSNNCKQAEIGESLATSSTQKFQASDGFALTYRLWNAVQARRAVVCIHGIGDYSGWFRNIAPALAEDGSEVYALDLRGFGESQEKGVPRGVVGDFERHLQDIDDFVVRLHSHHKNKKVFMLGHSLGGVYSLWYAANHPASVDGLVLAAPALACAISNTYSDQNRDPQEITIMKNDPLETWTLTPSYLSSVQRLLLDTALANACCVGVPALILQGAIDVTVQPQGAQELYDRLASGDKKLVLLEDAGHWFYDALCPALPRNKCDPAKRQQLVAVVKDWLHNH
jgi:acylglycerol lipase